MNLLFLIGLLSVTVEQGAEAGSTRQFTIAAIFDLGGDPKHKLAFRRAVHTVNKNSKILPIIFKDHMNS